MLLPEPDYVVLRPGPGLPDGFLPPDVDGRWVDRASLPPPPPEGGPRPDHLREGGPGAVAVPTGRFETRGDGAVAEVWEFQL